MKLTPKQTKAYKLAHSKGLQFILFGGAIRGGKTYWLLLTLISLCSKYPKSRWVVVRESLPTLKRNTLVTFEEIMNSGLHHHVADFNRETWVCTFKNGSQIMFMSESYDQDKEYNRFRGLEINGAGVDELNECQEKLLYKLFERSGSWLHAQGNPPIIVLATCNPTHNWVKEKIYDRWKEDDLPPTWAYIPSKITDNPHLPPEYLQSLKANMPPNDYLKFVEGDWEVMEKTENPFLHAYDPNRHESDTIELDRNKPILISVDFNLQPFCATVYQYYIDAKGGHHFYAVDELSVSDGSIPKMIDELKSRYEDLLPSCFLTGDAMGKKGDLSQRDNASYYEQLARGLKLRTSQIRVLPNPTHENSRAQCNYVLHNFPDLKIGKNCPALKRDCRSVEADASGQIIKRNRKVITQQADMLDTFRYAINVFLGEWYVKSLKKKS